MKDIHCKHPTSIGNGQNTASQGLEIARNLAAALQHDRNVAGIRLTFYSTGKQDAVYWKAAVLCYNGSTRSEMEARESGHENGEGRNVL